MGYGYGSNGVLGFLAGSVFFYIVILIVALIIAIWMANKMCRVADDKGYDSSSEHIFAVCFWLGLFGYLYVIALPDKKNQKLLESIKNELSRANLTQNNSSTSSTSSSFENGSSSNVWICSKCGETNPVGTTFCKKCGH